MSDYETMRAHMVACQIRPNKVADPRLVGALARVPRERFAPEDRRAVAYVDEDLEGRARALSHGAGGLRPPCRGNASGRSRHRARCGLRDRLLDGGPRPRGGVRHRHRSPSPDSRRGAGDLLAELGIDNATVVNRPLEEGYADQAPYDVIFLGGAIETVPEALSDQLAEGGRLVAVLRGRGAARRHGKAARFLKTRGRVSRRTLFDAAAAPLPGFRRSAGFAF